MGGRVAAAVGGGLFQECFDGEVKDAAFPIPGSVRVGIIAVGGHLLDGLGFGSQHMEMLVEQGELHTFPLLVAILARHEELGNDVLDRFLVSVLGTRDVEELVYEIVKRSGRCHGEMLSVVE